MDAVILKAQEGAAIVAGDKERCGRYICGLTMKLTIECNPSAFKHGVTLADIRSAFDNRLFERPVAGQDEKNLLIGLDRHLIPLEILYNEIDDCPKAIGFWAQEFAQRANSTRIVCEVLGKTQNFKLSASRTAFHAMKARDSFIKKLGLQEMIMARMTDEEADALDEELTRTIPELGPNGVGFFSSKGCQMVALDELTY